MTKTLVIFKKEFRGFLLSPSFMMVCGLCAVIMSWIYPIQLSQFANELRNFVFTPNMPQQQLNIHYGVFLRHLSYLNLVLLFVVPALAMRMLAEEKKMRTIDLLLTSPVTSAEIVVGKYLAVLGAVFIIVVMAFLYPWATSFFTKVNWTTLLIAFFGLFLVAAVYASMSLFASALTESAILAYVMAVIFNIAIWFIGQGIDVVDSSVARQVFEHVSLNQHLASLVEGTVRTSTMVFFASLIFLFVFLSERVVEASRWRS
jgi:ABC-2 type transport system permease protein